MKSKHQDTGPKRPDCDDEEPCQGRPNKVAKKTPLLTKQDELMEAMQRWNAATQVQHDAEEALRKANEDAAAAKSRVDELYSQLCVPELPHTMEGVASPELPHSTGLESSDISDIPTMSSSGLPLMGEVAMNTPGFDANALAYMLLSSMGQGGECN
jgi:hypothetical protein